MRGLMWLGISMLVGLGLGMVMTSGRDLSAKAMILVYGACVLGVYVMTWLHRVRIRAFKRWGWLPDMNRKGNGGDEDR